MPCEVLTTPESSIQIIACGPPKLFRRYYKVCESCEVRTAHLERFDGVYYGFSNWCMRCKHMWQDGMLMNHMTPTPRKTLSAYWNLAKTAKEYTEILHRIYDET